MYFFVTESNPIKCSSFEYYVPFSVYYENSTRRRISYCPKHVRLSNFNYFSFAPDTASGPCQIHPITNAALFPILVTNILHIGLYIHVSWTCLVISIYPKIITSTCDDCHCSSSSNLATINRAMTVVVCVWLNCCGGHVLPSFSSSTSGTPSAAVDVYDTFGLHLYYCGDNTSRTNVSCCI